jgi:hypothetical protein
MTLDGVHDPQHLRGKKVVTQSVVAFFDCCIVMGVE